MAFFYTPESARGSASVAGGSATAPTRVTVATIRVPPRLKLVVDALATYANTSAAFASPGLMFSLWVDGHPKDSFYRLRDQLGQQAQLERMPPGLVVANSILEFVIENDSGTTFTGGWAWIAHYEKKGGGTLGGQGSIGSGGSTA